MPETVDIPEEGSILALQADLAAGRTTSVQIVERCLRQIGELNERLNAVIAINPCALEHAVSSDAARLSRGSPGILSGIPILIKDNIETSDRMATTAGSLALRQNFAHRDAPVVARLRAAGAIIMGKANLSEWSNIRSAYSISGWSACGGQTRNPFALDRSPCGSSAGSCVATAADFAPAAIGTETDGSITYPASMNGVVGLKPTVGLVSRSGIVPVSRSQDTAGPVTRTVADAAALLGIIAGSDSGDPSTADADRHIQPYRTRLRKDALLGTRIGVMNFAANSHPQTAIAFQRALQILRTAGASLVDIDRFPGDALEMAKLEAQVILTELKADMNAYLAKTPSSVSVRTLADVIAFNREHADEELLYFGQELFEAAEHTSGVTDPYYLRMRSDLRRAAGPEGIDRMLSLADVGALVAPTIAPAWLIDPVLKDHFVGAGVSSPAAMAGYPHLTVPMGLVGGLPVGLSFIGSAWSEARLLSFGYAFESAARARFVPTYAPSVHAPAEPIGSDSVYGKAPPAKLGGWA